MFRFLETKQRQLIKIRSHIFYGQREGIGYLQWFIKAYS